MCGGKNMRQVHKAGMGKVVKGEMKGKRDGRERYRNRDGKIGRQTGTCIQ